MEIKYYYTDYKPQKASEGAACYDVYATEAHTIYPGARELVGTGVYVEVPSGYVLKLYPRSGLSLRGLTLANCTGIIDSDYRGEIKAIILNTSNDIRHIDMGDRIAQFMVERVEDYTFTLVQNLEDLSLTKRGDGGFGSTGT